jgi:hypothetical protein
MKHLEINGKLADMPNDPIGYTWQYFDMMDPEKRFNPYTTTIKLPKTPRNVSLIGYGHATGANLAVARDIPNVNFYLGSYKIISGGYLKVTSIDDTINVQVTSRTTLADTLEALKITDVFARAASDTGTIAASYADTITSLLAGTDGWILHRTIEDPVTSKTWLIHNYSYPNELPQHELWIKMSLLFETLETLGNFTFSVAEGGAVVDLQASTFYSSILVKLYTPAWNYIIYPSSYPSNWYPRKMTSGTRTVNGKSFEYSGVKLFGGRNAWEMIKLVGQLTGSIIYFSDGGIVIAPLSELDTFTPLSFTNRIKKPFTKYVNLPGYEATNYVRYSNSDNLAETYAQGEIPADVNPVKSKELLRLDLLLPGRYYNSTEERMLWNTSYPENGDLASIPLILYDAGTITSGAAVDIHFTAPFGTQSSSGNVKVLRQYAILSGYLPLYAAALQGTVYEADMDMNIYDLYRLKPYSLVRINELGKLFYLNKITNFDPESGKLAKVQLVKMYKITKSLDLEEVTERFVADYAADFAAVGITVTYYNGANKSIILTASTPGTDMTEYPNVETIADDLKGTIANVATNTAAKAREDMITLAGTGGRATITCNGVSKLAEFHTDLTTTAQNFVTDFAADYLAVGVTVRHINRVLIFTAVTPGVDFTGATTIVAGLPDLSGTVATQQANVAAVARVDNIFVTGTGGLIKISCNGISRNAGLKLQ